MSESGYDSNTISIVHNSKEKSISFLKHVDNDYSIHFIDSFQFMAPRLPALATHLITPGFEKFREITKVLLIKNTDFVTHKGVYSY